MLIKLMNKLLIGVVTTVFSFQLFANDSVTTVEEYNSKLPVWGTSWKPGSRAISGYYPSFYTGFIPRVQTPNRVHVRLSRGNQTRTSLILDENTVLDYLYDLKTRSAFYEELKTEEYINVSPKNSNLTQHLSHFQSVISNAALNATEDYEEGLLNKEELYLASLEKIKTLNPGRVFDIKIYLSEEYLDWRDQYILGDYSDVDTSRSSQGAMVLVNLLLNGRINLTRELSEDELNTLSLLIESASILSEEGFVLEADQLFDSVTDGKYNFKVIDSNSKVFVDAKVCTSMFSCTLTYTELSAIYPTGSLKASVRDANGNRISRYATPGLHAFIDTGSRGDVDNIRRESFYGFAPKMDYEGIGNGFHNPAVRHFPGRSVKAAMNIDSSHTTYWPVMRGGVSGGCSRLPLGHVWEMRHAFPVQNSLMKDVYYFGNDSKDFDLYDIDGDGQEEVMGVKYYIQYGLRGSSGLEKREGEGLALNSNIGKYFRSLYGRSGVFTELEGVVTMINPSISIHTVNDRWSGQRSSGKVISSHTFLGEYLLYEQEYEQDKAQFYTSYKVPGNNGFNISLSNGRNDSLGKRLVRLLGRVKGCAPFSNPEMCGSKAFEDEKAQIFEEIN